MNAQGDAPVIVMTAASGMAVISIFYVIRQIVIKIGYKEKKRRRI
jgi:hypothetical protein